MKQKRVALVLCQAKGATVGYPLKTTCPAMEKTARSFMVIVQREGDQLVDILLLGW